MLHYLYKFLFSYFFSFHHTKFFQSYVVHICIYFNYILCSLENMFCKYVSQIQKITNNQSNLPPSLHSIWQKEKLLVFFNN